MAKLVCEKCGKEQAVPKVCCGPGEPSILKDKLYCPNGCTISIETPKCCDKTMSYVK